MTVPMPQAVYGEIVDVLNYRCKPPRWEEGTVIGVRYGARFGPEFRWVYSVHIERPIVERPYGRNRGGGYSIDVGDDAVEPCP